MTTMDPGDAALAKLLVSLADDVGESLEPSYRALAERQPVTVGESDPELEAYIAEREALSAKYEARMAEIRAQVAAEVAAGRERMAREQAIRMERATRLKARLARFRSTDADVSSDTEESRPQSKG